MVKKMSIKLRDIKTRVIKEKGGSYAISCSALGVYTVGKTLAEAKKNFGDALELHLSVLKERAIEAVA
jgi:predicted RNase H-like HicB family nuclease